MIFLLIAGMAFILCVSLIEVSRSYLLLQPHCEGHDPAGLSSLTWALLCALMTLLHYTCLVEAEDFPRQAAHSGLMGLTLSGAYYFAWPNIMWWLRQANLVR